MTRVRFLFATWLICLVFSAAVQAQQSMPSPNSNDAGPTLPVTMQFIQDKVNNKGADLTRFDFGGGTGINPGDNQILEVTGDAASCTLKVAVTHTDQAQEVFHMTALLKDVQKVTATSSGDSSILQIRAGKTFFKLRGEFDFDARGSRLKDPKIFDDSVAAFSFRFRDPDMANRVGKAAQHAVDLCGGGNAAKPEPF